MNISCLTNPMTSVLSLCIHGWIPIRVVEYDRVSTCQVDTNTTAPSGQYENKDLVILVETLH